MVQKVAYCDLLLHRVILFPNLQSIAGITNNLNLGLVQNPSFRVDSKIETGV